LIGVTKKYFNVADDPSKADAAIVFASSPNGGPGYDATDVKNGGNGYVPISLQYEPYTAINARAYDFGYGMNWKGVIKDARTSKYIYILNLLSVRRQIW